MEMEGRTRYKAKMQQRAPATSRSNLLSLSDFQSFPKLNEAYGTIEPHIGHVFCWRAECFDRGRAVQGLELQYLQSLYPNSGGSLE